MREFAFRASTDWHWIEYYFSAKVGKTYKTILERPEFITFKNDYGKESTIHNEHFDKIVFLKEVKQNDQNLILDSLLDD